MFFDGAVRKTFLQPISLGNHQTTYQGLICVLFGHLDSCALSGFRRIVIFDTLKALLLIPKQILVFVLTKLIAIVLIFQ